MIDYKLAETLLIPNQKFNDHANSPFVDATRYIRLVGKPNYLMVTNQISHM